MLETVADALAELVPYDTLTIYRTRDGDRTLVAVVARDRWAEEIMGSTVPFGEGITGWAAEHREAVMANDALSDPRVAVVPGTPLEPEALISVPLVARGDVKGVLNIYRLGEGKFSTEDFQLARMFGDAAALALANAESRRSLEVQAKTDSLTGLYNHRYFHERLQAELARASRARDSIALLIVDIDDFKRLNDIHGHGVGDQVLLMLAEIINSLVRASEVVCRLGGEEVAVIMPSCDAGDALGLANRISEKVASTDFDPAGRLTVSIGVAQGPVHASNPRELVACADAAMLTAKARGKDRIVLFDDSSTDHPEVSTTSRDVRSIAHLKMLRSLAGKLNRLNEVREIGTTIATELLTLIDYHSCLVYLSDGDLLVPIAGGGELAPLVTKDPQRITRRVGEGIIGHVAASAQSLLVPNSLESSYAVQVSGTPEVEESLVAVPLAYGARVIGVILISSLGVHRFDDDDVRLLEVLAGHASVALENARLYESEKREAANAKALLEFAGSLSRAPTFHAIGDETVRFAARLMETQQASLWLRDAAGQYFSVAAHHGYVGDPEVEPVIRKRISKERGETFLRTHWMPTVLDPMQTDEVFGPTEERISSRTIAIAPLPGIDGWITVRQTTPTGTFTKEELRLLDGLAHQASLAMQKALLYREQKETAEIANSLLEFSRVLASAEGLEEVLTRVVEQAARILGSPRTAISIQDPDTRALVVKQTSGYEGIERDAALGLRVPAELVADFLAADEPFVVRGSGHEVLSRVLSDPQSELRNLVFAVAPLRLDDGLLGCLTVAAPALGDYEFSDRKMRLLGGLAYQTRLAIMNAMSFDNLERTFLSTVEALANALEAKDEYTSSHARWMTDMALEVGRELQLGQGPLKQLELGTLFHDIGKIGIPSELLLKPGPLSDEEWGIIKLHPELGERILAPIDRLAEVRKIVRACHEHYDGTGYPDGRSGEAIPIQARIILVVDAFHAMTSDRVYRKSLGVEEACSRLHQGRGTQFDPAVVDAFMRSLGRRTEPAVRPA